MAYLFLLPNDPESRDLRQAASSIAVVILREGTAMLDTVATRLPSRCGYTDVRIQSGIYLALIDLAVISLLGH